MTSKANSTGSAKIKIISNFILTSCFPPSTSTNNNNIGQSGQDIEISSSNNEDEVSHNDPTKIRMEESEHSSGTLDYEIEEIIEYDNNPSENEETISHKRKCEDSEDEGPVVFNYLTGAYEKVKKIKESSTILLGENEASNNETTDLSTNNKIYKCFDCNNFTSIYHNNLKRHVKQHSNSDFVCPDHLIATEDCLKCIYAKCLRRHKKRHSPARLKKHKKKHKKFKSNDQKYKYRCFHCDFKIDSKELLKYHVLKLHYKQTFRCNVHSSEVRKCRKCVYQKILTNLKAELLICKNCGFKTCREATFERHTNICDEKHTNICDSGEAIIDKKETSDDNNYEDFSDSEEEYSPFKNHYNKGKMSSKIHSNLVPDKLTTIDSQELPDSSSKDVCQDDNTNIIIIDDDETLPSDNDKTEDIKKEIQTSSELQYTSNKDETDIISSFEEQNYDFICYDCPFKAYMEADYLTSHAEAHPKSTFTCSEHGLFKIFCKRCIYQYTLMSIKLKKIICKYCPEKFENLESALIHMRGNCKQQPNYFTDYLMCYDCGLKPSTRQELFKHAACHRSNYQCFEHKEQQKPKSCSKCLYEFLVKSLFKCFKCDCSGLKSEFELRSHIEIKHLNKTYYPQIKCNKHSQLNECCRQCAMKQICDEVYLQKFCAICATQSNYLSHHIRTTHKNAFFYCQTHYKDKKMYGKCSKCYAEKVLESRGETWNCCQCDFRCSSKEEFELHIVLCHSLQPFMCSRHSLGDIQSDCDMCAYEIMVLTLSE